MVNVGAKIYDQTVPSLLKPEQFEAGMSNLKLTEAGCEKTNHPSTCRLYTRIELMKLITQADARRRNLVQLRSFDRFDVCILKN